MKALILACLVLLCATPASAGWWKTKTMFHCVEMTDIVLSSPDVPRSGAVSLTACLQSVNDRLVDVTATIIWFTGPDGDYLAREYYPLSLATRDLVINPAMTRATLHLPDGSVITWVGSGDGDNILSDISTHTRFGTFRNVRQETGHWATATGSLGGMTFDAQNAGGTPRGTSIFTVIYYDE